MTAPVIVSLTPLPLEADTRTLKIAKSFARAGFRSIIIEGQPSAYKAWGDDVTVLSVAQSHQPPQSLSRQAQHAQRPSLKRRMLRHTITALRSGRMGIVGECILMIAFIARYFSRYRWAVRGKIPDAAVYYIHSYEYFGAVAPIARRNRAKIFYDAHDFYQGIEPDASLPSFDRRFLMPLLARLEARFINAASRVITVTDGTATLMKNRFGCQPAILRNSHDPRLEMIPAQDLRTRLGLPSDVPLLTVVGNWKRGMAITQTLDALLQLPETVHLAFVGRGYEAIASQIAAHPCGSRVHIGLAVSPMEVVPFIRSATIGLVIYHGYSNNYQYALPNGFFQIVAANLPVVHPNLPEIVTAVGDFQIGPCLKELSADTIAAAVQNAMTHTEAYRQESHRLAEQLSWVTEEKKLLAVLDA